MGVLARSLILIGAVLMIAGLVLLAVKKNLFAGRLPGDIVIKKENYTLYFPIATSIILSIILSLVLYLFNKFK